MSGFECLVDLIINDDGVSGCDAGYVCFLCISIVKLLMRNEARLPSVDPLTRDFARVQD